MSDGRYNIPKQYKVDKGMPLEVLFQRIDNLKCRRIFESGIESVEWSYHLVDKEGIANRTELVKERGVSLFEVKLRRKISPDLLTEVFAGLLQRPMVLAYLCDDSCRWGHFYQLGREQQARCAQQIFIHMMQTE